MDRNKVIKELKKIADTNELRASKRFYALLRRQYSAVAAYIDKYGIDAALSVLDGLVTATNWYSPMQRYYQEFGTDSASWQYRLLRNENPTKSIGDDIRGFLTGWLRDIALYISASTASKVTEINDTTREHIRRELQNAREQGLGARETAKLIRDNNRINQARALVIARTEGTKASSEGHRIASESWGRETGQQRYKQWFSLHDQRVRPDHAEADGQTVPDNLLFNVGGYGMDAPGDDRAPANLVINCRCRCIYMSARQVERLGLEITY